MVYTNLYYPPQCLIKFIKMNEFVRWPPPKKIRVKTSAHKVCVSTVLMLQDGFKLILQMYVEEKL